MRIEVTNQAEGLRGGPEVWVRVLSNRVVDWPTVEKELDPRLRERLKGMTLTYYPALADEDHEYEFEDWFTWSSR